MLLRLAAVLEARRGGDPATSYVARLIGAGLTRIVQKVGEEAVETVIAGAQTDRAGLVRESADLLFHLLVLWAAAGVSPAEVAAELARREGVSGLAEKAARDTNRGGQP
ncbi:MAG: phosphoribosyl-ATP diphosphatase [Alphaproteobacteria bacterium]|nr:phosphoribosyl-ATP diphosphatase [Alphaproteobacteria bacterium]